MVKDNHQYLQETRNTRHTDLVVKAQVNKRRPSFPTFVLRSIPYDVKLVLTVAASDMSMEQWHKHRKHSQVQNTREELLEVLLRRVGVNLALNMVLL